MTAQPLSTRVSSPLFAHLIPSLALAVVVTVLFWWNPFGRPPQFATFHVLMKSDVAGQALLVAGVDHIDIHKATRISQPVEGGNRQNHLQFSIPTGRLHGFSLNLLDKPAEVELQQCWITDQAGELLLHVPLADLLPSLQGHGARLTENGLRFQTVANGALAGLRYVPSLPIELAVEPPPPFWEIVVVFLGTLVGFTALSSALVPRRDQIARTLTRWGGWCVANPVKAILLAAIASVLLSTFPVVFCGKSFVSPNNGMLLLYDKFPTVPDSPGGGVENSVGSDIGATMYWHLPASIISYRALFRDGELPLWNRYNWSGVTFLGQGMTMLGDPLHWPAVLTGGAAWAWDLKFVLAKILFALGVGLVVRRATGSVPVALLLAMSAPWIGFFAYRFCHAAFFSLCYAPWILLAWLEGIFASTLRRAALWAGALLVANWWQLSSGTAKEAVAFIVLLNAVGGLAMLMAAQPWRWRWQRLAVFGWASVLFVLLSAPFWFVFLAALGKAWTVYDSIQVYQLQPGLAVGLFDDIFHRQVMPIEFLFNPSSNFFMLLAVAWALVRIRTLVREPLFLAALIVALVTAIFVFGIISPSITAAIPFFNRIYHFDDTFSGVLFILFFVIGGFGLRECWARRDKAEWVGDGVCVMVLIGLLLANYFGFMQAGHHIARGFLAAGETIPKSPFFVAYVSVIVIAVMLFPWALRLALRDRRAGPAWGLVALCMFAALHFRHGMYLETRFDLYTMNPKTRMDLRDLHSPALDHLREVRKEPARVFGLDWVFTPGFSIVPGLETTSGPDPLLNPKMIELCDTLGVPRVNAWHHAMSTDSYKLIRRELDFLNVRYLLNSVGEPHPDGARLLGSYDLNLYESDTAWPRAFFTDAAYSSPNAQVLAAMIDKGDGRPFAAFPPDTLRAIALPPKDLAERVINKAQNYRLTSNTTSFEIDAPSRGVAVLMEANDREDVQAFVDDHPAPSLTVNHVFRGVAIESPGHHRVRFAYWPRALGPALVMGALGLLGLLASIVIWFRLRSSERGEELPEPTHSACASLTP